MIPLLICSVISLALILERSLFWRNRNNNRNLQSIRGVMDAILAKDLPLAEKLSSTSTDPLASFFIAVLQNPNNFSSAVDLEINKAEKELKKNMPILSTIITIAPLLGILGTVIGIILSFDILSQAGMQDPKLVTGGISQAMITTATGLTIAIFTIVPYNFFQSRIDQSLSEIEQYLSRLEMEIKI